MRHVTLALAITLGALASPCIAQVDFVRDVRPIFEKHCYECHSGAKQKAGLRLDVKSAALKGGENYSAGIVAGKPQESSLIRLITGQDGERMPPEGAGVSAAEIATLTKWIEQGAVWPDDADRVKLTDPREHWSFQPRAHSLLPPVQNPAWLRQGIDAFILARLEQNHLKPSPEADRATWLRRVTFDLTGLPPTPESIASFVSDSRPDAYQRVVDELLSSPRYGERWAQHWLDVVRYADTHGFEVNTERPNAWPYRDYVISALNNDKPYDQFIREQLTGDALGEDAATGFLITASVLLPGQIGADEPSKRLARQDALDEIVVNIGQTFIGMTIGCARCHDHKFDPISQRDYYAMQAFVAGVEYADREWRTPEAESLRKQAEQLKPRLAAIDQELAQLEPLALAGKNRSMINARQNHDRFEPIRTKRARFTIRATNSLEPCIDELEVFNTAGENVALATSGAKVTSSGDTVSANRHELQFVNDGQYGNERSWMSSEVGRGWVEVEFPAEQEICRVAWGRDRQAKYQDRLAIDYAIELESAAGDWKCVADSSDRQKFDATAKPSSLLDTKYLGEKEAQYASSLLKERADIESKIQSTIGKVVFGGNFRTPDVIHLLTRGDPEQPKEEVVAAIPELFREPKPLANTAELDRRRTLAEWIISPANPLTARVMVNRIWQGHFGAGLVETPNDFGLQGAKPTHPELLEWLAEEFIRSGWSIKSLHRQIVLSATYRQAASHDETAATKDADVRLLWRYPSRRLDAESIRDAMLAASGRLNLQMGGPGFNQFEQRGGLSGFTPVETPKGDGLRRMIYAHKVRRERDVVFGAFDCPDGGQSAPLRRESTTPIQALNLLNSRFTLGEAKALADRVTSEAPSNVNKQIERAYHLALGRRPELDEVTAIEPLVREHGLTALCRALFNSNEFVQLP